MSAHVATARNHRPFEQDIVVDQLLSVLDTDIKWLPLGFVMKNHEVKTNFFFLNFPNNTKKNTFRIYPSKIIVLRWVSKPNSDNLDVFFIHLSETKRTPLHVAHTDRTSRTHLQPYEAQPNKATIAPLSVVFPGHFSGCCSWLLPPSFNPSPSAPQSLSVGDKSPPAPSSLPMLMFCSPLSLASTGGFCTAPATLQFGFSAPTCCRSGFCVSPARPSTQTDRNHHNVLELFIPTLPTLATDFNTDVSRETSYTEGNSRSDSGDRSVCRPTDTNGWRRSTFFVFAQKRRSLRVRAKRAVGGVRECITTQLLWHSALVPPFYVEIGGLTLHPERLKRTREGPEELGSCWRRRRSVADETENRGNIPRRRERRWVKVLQAAC